MQHELLSLMALVIALTSVIINYLILRANRDPEVIIYAQPDLRRPSFINLIIVNIGKGIARDISFVASRSIPHRAFGIESASMPEPMTEGPLIYGISFLGPGDKRIITWGQYAGLCKGLNDDPLDITANYRSQPPLRFMSQQHGTTSRIDIKTFKGTDGSDLNWDKKTAEHLKDISLSLKKFVDTRH